MLENNDTITIKDVIATTSPFVNVLVDTFLKPKLVAFRDKYKKSKDISLPNELDFNEYYSILINYED